MRKTSNDDGNPCPVPKGLLVVIGGAEDKGDKDQGEEAGNHMKLEVLECFMSLVKREKPHIEIMTSGSSKDPAGSFREYEKIFGQMGAGTINHIHHDTRKEVHEADLNERLIACDGIFIAGGNQLKITSIYGGTELLTLLKNRYIDDNIVIAGTSAGAMALSTPMIYAGVGRDEMITGNVKVTTGLEFIRDVCIDTHFVDRGRFVRMAQVIATNPTCIGVGIEEDTCIIIREGRHAEIIGSGVVIIMNGQNLEVSSIEQGELLSMRGMQVDILSKGESYTIPQMNPPHK